MAKEDSVYVQNKKLVFPPSLNYVSVIRDTETLFINKKPCRGQVVGGMVNVKNH